MAISVPDVKDSVKSQYPDCACHEVENFSKDNLIEYVVLLPVGTFILPKGEAEIWTSSRVSLNCCFKTTDFSSSLCHLTYISLTIRIT
jgi:hypothetical protein